VSNYPKYDKYSQFESKKKLSYYERLGFFFRNAKRILKIANKPGRKDYFLVFKICAIGLALLGGASYAIQLILNLMFKVLGVS